MVACEPQDHILAVLLETNDQLLAAISSWDATVHRLTLVESQQPAATPSTSDTPSVGTQQQPDWVGSSKQSSAEAAAPAVAPAGGSFWDSASPQANSAYPAQRQSHNAPFEAQSSDHGLPNLHNTAQASTSSSNYLDELGSLPVSQYPNQQLQSDADAWQAFDGGPAQVPATSSSPSRQAAQDPAARDATDPSLHEYHGSVLSYTLKERQPEETITYPQIADPFAGRQ